jgi:hypothetical protein
MFRRFQSWCLHCSISCSDGETNLRHCPILPSNADQAQLDYIGLLSTGNEEMLRFAWKTFSRWQMRTESSDKEKKEKHESFRYMEQFRETFSRPIDSIRFVGLFDCVNRLVETRRDTSSTLVLTHRQRTSVRSGLDEAVPLSIHRANVCGYSPACGLD